MRFSVVIPSYQRRDVVTRMVTALQHQVERDFEVVVVVDGSKDGTAEALMALTPRFPVTVVEQSNQGAAAARNAGAAASAGEILVFLDDDMEADPRLLIEHDRSHRCGHEVVFGHLALHRDSAANLLSDGVREWTDGRLQRLSAADGKLGMEDLLTGQVSLSAELFRRIGGFDPQLTREGMFGGEDIDFGYRLKKAGCDMVFNSAAITYQLYAVDPADYLTCWREAGRAEAELILKHPEGEVGLRRRASNQRVSRRVLVTALAAAPDPTTSILRSAVTRWVRGGRGGSLTHNLFFALRDSEYRRGLQAARRVQKLASVAVLAYHAIDDLNDDPVLASYGVPPAQLAAQLDYLSRRGRQFVSLEMLRKAIIKPEILPADATLVTFDDAYSDLLPAVKAILEPRGIPAVAFAVTGKVGATSDWDRRLGARALPLLAPDELLELRQRGVVIGSHTVTHRSLLSVRGEALTEELRKSADQLEAMGLPRPDALAYPYGECDDRVVAAARSAGYTLAFTVSAGFIRGDSNPHALPRVEVLARDTPFRLWLKLALLRWTQRLPPALKRKFDVP